MNDIWIEKQNMDSKLIIIDEKHKFLCLYGMKNKTNYLKGKTSPTKT